MQWKREERLAILVCRLGADGEREPILGSVDQGLVHEVLDLIWSRLRPEDDDHDLLAENGPLVVA
jgi:hypothetical protein